MDKPRGSPPSEAMCPQSSSPPRKIGIINKLRTNEVYQVKIYLLDVDLDSSGIEEHTRILPVVRFLFPHAHWFHAICLLNSTVYIFGGDCTHRRHEPEAKSAHKFVLSSEVLAQPNYPVELGGKTQLAEISLMKYAKGVPKALPTPDGEKIIVFSCSIRRKDSNHAFELYDPNGDYWEQLPPLPCSACNSREQIPYRGFRCNLCTDDKILCVQSYSFLDESHFLINFGFEMGAFTLDLKNRAWTALRIKIPSFEGNFVVVKGRYILFPKSTYDLGDDGYFAKDDADARDGFGYSHEVPRPLYYLGDDGYFAEDAEARHGFGYSHEVPLSTFDSPDVPEWDEQEPLRSIVPLHPVVENGVCSTCVLQLDPYREDRVLIDVRRTELSTLNTTVSNCLRLHIDFFYDFDDMDDIVRSDISLISV